MKKKFYKKAKPKESKKFPRNYRNIPEKLLSHSFFISAIFLILITLFFLSLDFYSNYKENRRLKEEKTRVLNEISFWKEQLKIYPNYRDGYFKLSLLEFQLNNFNEVNRNLEKALILDPNFEKGRELQQILNSK